MGKNTNSSCRDWKSFKGEVTLAPGLEGQINGGASGGENKCKKRYRKWSLVDY